MGSRAAESQRHRGTRRNYYQFVVASSTLRLCVSVASLLTHVQGFADGRIAADAPDFRVEVVMNEGITPEEGNT